MTTMTTMATLEIHYCHCNHVNISVSIWILWLLWQLVETLKCTQFFLIFSSNSLSKNVQTFTTFEALYVSDTKTNLIEIAFER